MFQSKRINRQDELNQRAKESWLELNRLVPPTPYILVPYVPTKKPRISRLLSAATSFYHFLVKEDPIIRVLQVLLIIFALWNVFVFACLILPPYSSPPRKLETPSHAWDKSKRMKQLHDLEKKAHRYDSSRSKN